MKKTEIIQILETEAKQLRAGLAKIGRPLLIINPEVTYYKGTWYQICAEFGGRAGLFVEILYDDYWDSLWAGFGADDQGTLNTLLEDCGHEIAPRIFRSFNEIQGAQLEEGCPIVESYDVYNGV